MIASDTREELRNQQAATHTEICRWRVAAASVRGTSHEKVGQPCQDVHCWEKLPESVLVAAVADGAGSAALGEVGAAIAARTAVETMCSLRPMPRLPEDDGSWRLLLIDAIRAARVAVETEAAVRALPVRDLATTLILVVATPELVAAAQVGDGAAVVSDVEGHLLTLTVPESGEYINETNFLISPDALDTAQVTVWRGTAAHLAALSDGLQMLALKMPDGTPYVPFFSPLFRFVADMKGETQATEQLVAFLSSRRITERTDDDLTLLLAACVR